MEIIPFEYNKTGQKTKRIFCQGKFANKTIQGACYDSRNNRYVVSFSHDSDPLRSTLVCMKKLDFSSAQNIITIREGLELRHCNDLEYVPNEHKIYVARGDTNIAVVNPDSLTIDKLIPVDICVWALAKYPNGSWFLFNNNSGRKYTSDFKLSKILSTNDEDKIAAILGVPSSTLLSYTSYRGYWQSAVMINNTPFAIYTEWSDTPGVYKSCVLVSFWGDNGTEVYRAETPYETEGVCISSSKMKFVYGNIFIGGAEWDMAELTAKIVFGTIKNVSVMVNENKEIDFSEYVPAGYKLMSANVAYKKGSYWRSLPYCTDSGKCVTKLLRVVDNKIVLRSSEEISSTNLQITGFCKRI